MRKKQGLFGLALLLLSLFVGFASMASASSGVLGLRTAPLSPAFLAYRESLAQKDTGLLRSANFRERLTGYIPSPVDFSHLRSADYAAYFAGTRRRVDLPVSYDLRTADGVNVVTPVENQLPYGACWAFSTLGSMESVYLRRSGATLRLSPMHLAYYTYMMPGGFTIPPGNQNVLDIGGNDLKAIALLARWIGPVLETALPYGAAPSASYATYPNVLHLQNVYFASMKTPYDQSRGANDIRKRLIMEHGGIAIGYASSRAGYNEGTFSWYNGSSAPLTDHGVLVIGWDDNYSRDNFNASGRPSQNGAWLVQNSWGADWGDEGYFWLSYEEKSIEYGTVYLPEATSNYANVYDYDTLGLCGGWGNTQTAWMANVFKSRSSENLEAVAFYTLDANASYEISVYTGLRNTGNPTSGTLASRQTGSQTFAGYHTVKLNAPVSLANGTTFAVAVRMTTPTYNYPIPMEVVLEDHSENAVAGPGESFFSLNGTTWIDGVGEANACLKAFTSNSSGSVPTPDPTPTPTPTPDPTPSPNPIPSPDPIPSQNNDVVSESAADWTTQAVEISGSAVYDVTFRGPIDVTKGEISNITASSTGLLNSRATIENVPRADAPTGKIYYTLSINGTTADLNQVSLRGISFTQGGVRRTQTFDAPIWLKQTPSGSGSGSGGGGGCSSVPGSLFFAVFLPLFRRQKVKEIPVDN